MERQTKERWRELCQRAEKEQDPTKLLALLQEISRLLDENDHQFEPEKQMH